MSGYYTLIDTLRQLLIDSPFVNQVTEGDLYDIDLSKQTIFPLSHIMVNNVSILPNVLKANITIIAMDIVDISKSEPTSLFLDNNNRQDVLNTQLIMLSRIVAQLTNGETFEDNYQLEGEPSCEPFTDRFENLLAGWTMTFDVLIPNEMTSC
jgi:hypothetical protein